MGKDSVFDYESFYKQWFLRSRNFAQEYVSEPAEAENIVQEHYYSKSQIHVATNADEVIEVAQSDLPMAEPNPAAIEYFSPRRLVEYLRECAK